MKSSLEKMGAWSITLDPVFSGLAWLLIFGLVVSIAFTLVLVPLVYHMLYALCGKRRGQIGLSPHKSQDSAPGCLSLASGCTRASGKNGGCLVCRSANRRLQGSIVLGFVLAQPPFWTLSP